MTYIIVFFSHYIYNETTFLPLGRKKESLEGKGTLIFSISHWPLKDCWRYVSFFFNFFSIVIIHFYPQDQQNLKLLIKVFFFNTFYMLLNSKNTSLLLGSLLLKS